MIKILQKVFLFTLFDSFLVYTFAGSVMNKLSQLKYVSRARRRPVLVASFLLYD